MQAVKLVALEGDGAAQSVLSQAIRVQTPLGVVCSVMTLGPEEGKFMPPDGVIVLSEPQEEEALPEWARDARRIVAHSLQTLRTELEALKGTVV